MQELIHRFFLICLFKAGPADLPASHWFVKLIVFVYFLIGVVVSHIDYSWLESVAASFADTTVMLVVSWSLLAMRGLTMRYIQTVSALAGTGIVMGLLGWPIFWLFRQVEPDQYAQTSSFVLLLVLVMVLWSLFVTAHIFRYALEIKPVYSVLLTIAYIVLSLMAVGLMMSGVV